MKKIFLISFVLIALYLLVTNATVYVSAAKFFASKFSIFYSALVTGKAQDV